MFDFFPIDELFGTGRRKRRKYVAECRVGNKRYIIVTRVPPPVDEIFEDRIVKAIIYIPMSVILFGSALLASESFYGVKPRPPLLPVKRIHVQYMPHIGISTSILLPTKLSVTVRPEVSYVVNIIPPRHIKVSILPHVTDNVNMFTTYIVHTYIRDNVVDTVHVTRRIPVTLSGTDATDRITAMKIVEASLVGNVYSSSILLKTVEASLVGNVYTCKITFTVKQSQG